MDFVDYYCMLGVLRDASNKEIKKAYRKFANMYHYDKLKNKVDNGEISQKEFDDINEYFKELTAAYSVLINEKEREEYNRIYDEHYRMEEERRRKREERRERTERKTKSNTKSTVNYDEGFIDSIKRAYREVKDEEERQPSFRKRHQNIDDYYYEEYFDFDMNGFDNVLFQTGRGVIHVSIEFLYNIYKLKYITEDSVPKFVIRNRRLAALLLAGVIGVNTVGLFNNSDKVVEDSSATTSSNDVSLVVDEEIDDIVTLNRIYEIQFGDTLSKIAVDSGTSQYTIQKVNNLESAGYIVAGDELIIPYSIDSENLCYYTYSVEYDRSISLEEFAKEYDTDVDSLIELNKEAIVEDHGVYAVLSDTLNVPNFITQKELKEKQERQYN